MRSIVFISVILLTGSLTGCSEKSAELLSFSGFTQGTTYSVIYYNTAGIGTEEMQKNIDQLFADFDNSLSTYNPGSIISRINANEEAVPDSLFMAVFNRSREVWEMTGGLFDITAGPLVNAWGFGPDAKKRFDESKLDSLMNLVGMDKVRIVDGKVVKDNPAMYLDVNAIAQGYSADVAGKYLEKLGVLSYLVEIGGEVRTHGTKKKGESWKIAVDKPEDNNFIPGQDVQTIIALSGRSLATSGNYRKFYIENGVKYSHTINPLTGHPVMHNLLSTTIIADDCMTADAIATACMVMGLEKAKEFLTAHSELEGYLVYSGEDGAFATWMTEGMENYISE